MLKLFLVALCFSQSCTAYHRNNVCNAFEDYATIQINKNCYYNPDVDSSPSQIAARYGFPFEHHNITTEDGYVLGLFRIPHDNVNTKFRRQPVFLEHGFLSSAATWMLLGEKSLAFVLARNGYDVWLGNFRGNEFSSGHENPEITEKEYWNFSFHEIGYYDLPACTDFISKLTGNKKDIIYIGHSMGTTVLFIYTTLKKQDAELKLEKILALAPIAYMKNLKGMAPAALQLIYSIRDSLENAGIYAIGQYLDLQRLLGKFTCNIHPLICAMFQALFTGLVERQLNPVFPLIASYLPQGISTKTIYHYSQLSLNHGRFGMYDLGTRENMRVYNSSIPPEYPLEEISIPVHLFLAVQDFLADRQDVNLLYNKLTCTKSLHEIEMAHNDFIFGADVEIFYESLLKVMRLKNKTP